MHLVMVDGLTIGSETSGGIINVTYENIVVHHQTAGIHIKSPVPRGSIIQNITYRNIEFKDVRQCILIDVGGALAPNKSVTPMVDGVLFENIRCDNASTSSYDMGGLNKTYPIRIALVNVTMAQELQRRELSRDRVHVMLSPPMPIMLQQGPLVPSPSIYMNHAASSAHAYAPLPKSYRQR